MPNYRSRSHKHQKNVAETEGMGRTLASIFPRENPVKQLCHTTSSWGHDIERLMVKSVVVNHLWWISGISVAQFSANLCIKGGREEKNSEHYRGIANVSIQKTNGGKG